ncbi:MAG: hypothetical protein FJW20_15775 [Acidimicrobiia bacterium]|nr:hypothetical protein [Acidimicrobiia bacterium]
MRKASPLLLLAVVCASAQVQIQPGPVQLSPLSPPPGAASKPLDPEHVVAKVNGEAVRVKDVQRMLSGAPPQARQSAAASGRDYLQWTYLLRKLSQQAEEQGLDKKAPYADRLEWSRLQILMRAMLEQANQSVVVSEDKLKEYYEEHPEEFGKASARILYLALGDDNKEAVKTKAETLAKQARAGADFVQLVKQHSDDKESTAKNGDFGEVTVERRLAPEIKRAVVGAKPGEITGPFEQEGGYYIFQTVSVDRKPLAEVRPMIRQKLQQGEASQLVESMVSKIHVMITLKEFFEKFRLQAGPFADRTKPQMDGEYKPDAILVMVDGKPVTLEQYTNLLHALPPSVHANAVRMPEQFFRQRRLMQKLAEMAEQAGLDKVEPHAGRLRHDRMQLLTQAMTDEYLSAMIISPEEPKEVYEQRKDTYKEATAKVLYISYSLTPPPQTDPNAPKILVEAEAKAKAEDMLRQVKEGVSFQALIALHSEDADSKENDGVLPPIPVNDANVPEHIRKAIFATEPGHLTPPLRTDNGFYIFEVMKITEHSFEEMKDKLLEEIRQAKFQKWFDENRSSIEIELLDQAAFQQAAAQ